MKSEKEICAEIARLGEVKRMLGEHYPHFLRDLSMPASIISVDNRIDALQWVLSR